MMSLIDTVVQKSLKKSQIYYTRISKWQNRVNLNLEFGPYILKMAQTHEEVLQCFRLRHDVFCIDLAEKPKKSKLDFDKFDLQCDHLIIIHKETNEVIGTYRMNFTSQVENLYSATEFDLEHVLQAKNLNFVELGRACIHHDHRRGAVISLLWRGITEYMKIVEATGLIGCSSVKCTDARSAALIFKYFVENNMISENIAMPLENYQMQDFFFWLSVFAKDLTEEQRKEAEDKIPSLLKSYVKAGAKICSYPAYDRDFKCLDFITILNRSDLDSKLVRKFKVG